MGEEVAPFVARATRSGRPSRARSTTRNTYECIHRRSPPFSRTLVAHHQSSSSRHPFVVEVAIDRVIAHSSRTDAAETVDGNLNLGLGDHVHVRLWESSARSSSSSVARSRARVG